ncbi:hypothetical protein O3P69_011165 [Scylla paramamosain]|uniref:Helicase ATP-binding domain-containing protein n=1 Tax=Scylla paramamosain TaxID=85552 RepID=A0AAW0STN0_SCYPA
MTCPSLQTAEVTQHLIPQQATLRCATTTTTTEGGGRGTAHQIVKCPSPLTHTPTHPSSPQQTVKRHTEGINKPQEEEVAIRDVRALQQHTRRYSCVDEGHRLKNLKCRLIKSLNTFPPMNRLLLTGTALQNSLTELWALLKFLMQDIFYSLDICLVLANILSATRLVKPDGGYLQPVLGVLLLCKSHKPGATAHIVSSDTCLCQ